MDKANTATDANLTKQVNDLKHEVGNLKAKLKKMKDAGSGSGGGGGAGGGASNSSGTDTSPLPRGCSKEDAERQMGPNRNKLAWKNDLKMNDDWNYQKSPTTAASLSITSRRSSSARRRNS